MVSYAPFSRPDAVTAALATISTSTDGLSDAVRIFGHVVVGLAMPSSWTSADLTFQGSDDGVTFRDIWSSTGGETTVTTTGGRYIPLNPDAFWGLSWIKLRSGISTAQVAQGAEREVKVVLRSAF